MAAADAGAQSLSADDLASLRASLVALLPASYGVASGCLVTTHGEQSQPIDIIIYDKTTSDVCPENEQRPVAARQALLALSVGVYHDRASLAAALGALAGAKALRTTAHTNRAPSRASHRAHLPLAALVYWKQREFPELGSDQNEAYALLLDSMLKRHTPTHRPEVIHAFGHAITYRSPVLEGCPFDALTIGITREPVLTKPRPCYICQAKFYRRHFFYEHLCSRCGDRNYLKRTETANLHGKVALLTGGRLKIGYATALRLLRAGASVIVTTRFSHDAARRFSHEADFADWSDRLHIYRLDLRHTPSIEGFAAYLNATYPRLDILINNAAQTIRRPAAFYAHLLPFEQLPLDELPVHLHSLLRPAGTHVTMELAGGGAGAGDMHRPVLSVDQSGFDLRTGQIRSDGESLLPVRLPQMQTLPDDAPYDMTAFPPGGVDRHGQQLDLRAQNSWTMKLEDIILPELLEVQLINVIAPTMLIALLKPLMLRGEGNTRFIVNVAAAEGQFAQQKRGVHPHTNMAKAALNMLTHTSAADYASAGIYMNSVDPGWISQQAPVTTEVEQSLGAEMVPLDEFDAAARICDPIYTGLTTGRCEYGRLFKDYAVAPW